MPVTRFTSNPPPPEGIELPAEGFPFAEQELRGWFRHRYARDASSLEIGALMAAMAARDAKPGERKSQLWGWRVEPADNP